MDRLQQLITRLASLSDASDTDLAEIETEALALFDAITENDVEVDDRVDALRQIAAGVNAVQEEAGTRIDAAQAEHDQVQEIADTINRPEASDVSPNPDDPPAEDPPAEDPPATGEDPPADPSAEDPPADPPADPTPEEVEALAAAARPPLGAFRSSQGTPAPVVVVDEPEPEERYLVAAGGVRVTDTTEAERRLVEAHQQYGPAGAGAKMLHPILQFDYEVDDSLMLHPGEAGANRKKVDALVADAGDPDRWAEWEAANEDMAAAGVFCAPSEPFYEQPILGVTDRRIRPSMPGAPMARGRVNVTASPVLSDILVAQSGGALTNVVSGAGTTKTIQTITSCPSDPTVTALDAIVFRLRFDNFQAMTWEERQDAFIQLARIAAARYKEQLLLEKADALSRWVTHGGLLGVARDMLVAVDRLASQERTRLRLPSGYRFRLWMAEDDFAILRSDVARQMPGDGLETLRVAEAEIRGWLQERGVNLTVSLDRQVYAAQGGALGGPGETAMNSWKTRITWNLFPEGTFIFGGGQQLLLGIVRDSVVNAANEFEMFEEEFETLFRVGGWPAYRVRTPVCVSGETAGTVDTSCTGS